MATSRDDYFSVLTDAVNFFAENGYVSEQELKYWQDRLRAAAERSMRTVEQMQQDIRNALAATYKRLVENGGAAKYNPGVQRFTIDMLKPQLHAALERRIMASADLIKLNRPQAIEKTLQRFYGWATSIPPGGAAEADKVDIKQKIRKPLASLPYEERRLHIDQGHKLVANINETIAIGSNAIGFIWKSHFRQAGYDYREDHKERDGHFYMLKGNWAQEKGLVKPGKDGYYDSITHAAEEINCRCYTVSVFNLRSVPPECLTIKGEEELKNARARIASM